ncbi:MAG: chromate efflux transporter [Cytophagales bacterium]|nr:chromate efflux transporter [Cytophagales bacterium]
MIAPPAAEPGTPVQKPTLGEAFRFWLKLGFISFGGPAGQIAIMHQFLVEHKRWISDARFLHALNYCMLLPGPEAQQLATYIGWLLHGVRGGLVAGILFVLPSVFILLGLSMAYVTFGTIPWVGALFDGLKPAVVAIVVMAIFKIGKKSLLTPFHYGVAAASFVAIFFGNVPFPLIIAGTLVVAAAVNALKPGLLEAKVPEGQRAADEHTYYLNLHRASETPPFRWRTFGVQLAVGVVLWLIPLALFFAWSADFPFWRKLTVFFTQAAFVTFGGAYAVLPYVAQVSVEKFGWLTEYQMIDGLALGETTPGPLIMVLAFVGFMAGYNHGGAGSLALGTVGLLATTFYTFLPCFLLIFMGAPFVERSRYNPRIKAVLGVVTAAVVGVVLNLAIYLARAVAFPKVFSWEGANYFALAWIVVSLAALWRFKVNMILWIALSAVAGLAYYLVLGE